MIKNILRKFPIHTFLFGPVLIFFLFIHNYCLVPFGSILRSLMIFIGISIFVFVPTYFIFKKNLHKAGTVSSAFMLIFLFYGFIYELLEDLYFEGLWPFSHIHRNMILIIFILLTILSFFLFKTKRTFKSFTYWLNIFVVSLFTINAARASFKIIKQPDFIEEKSTVNNAQKNISDTLPDIYYIILDGYANDSVLAESFNYKNNNLTDFLKKNNFYVAAGSRTNYISTAPSLGSSLNLSYLDSINNHEEENTNIIYSNKVSEYLHGKGYKIVHIRSGYSVSRENNYADTTVTLENLNEFERTLLRYSIFRLDDVLGYSNYKTLKEQLCVMHHAIKISGPKYVFLHIVSPHPPYVCEENGSFKSSPRIANLWWEPKKDYLVQLKYINKEIITFISEINKQSKVNPIIILQSDHGPWIQSDSFNEIYNSRCMILNAYCIPYKWNEKLYSTITPVNSFRFIFNGLFKDSIPILKDIPLDSQSVKNNMNSNLILKPDL